MISRSHPNPLSLLSTAQWKNFNEYFMVETCKARTAVDKKRKIEMCVCFVPGCMLVRQSVYACPAPSRAFRRLPPTWQSGRSSIRYQRVGTRQTYFQDTSPVFGQRAMTSPSHIHLSTPSPHPLHPRPSALLPSSRTLHLNLQLVSGLRPTLFMSDHLAMVETGMVHISIASNQSGHLYG